MNFTQLRISVIDNIIDNHPLLEKLRNKLIGVCLDHIKNIIIRKIMFKMMNVEELKDMSVYFDRLYIKRCHQEKKKTNSIFFNN